MHHDGTEGALAPRLFFWIVSIVVIILVALAVWSVKDGFLVILAAPYIYQYEEDRGKKGQQPHDGAGLN